MRHFIILAIAVLPLLVGCKEQKPSAGEKYKVDTELISIVQPPKLAFRIISSGAARHKRDVKPLIYKSARRAYNIRINHTSCSYKEKRGSL